MKLYGLKTCDTCRKARKWLDGQADYAYVDVRDDGLTAELLKDWFARVDWQTLVNRRSTTWKNLSPADRESLSRDSAVELLLEGLHLSKRLNKDAVGGRASYRARA